MHFNEIAKNKWKNTFFPLKEKEWHNKVAHKADCHYLQLNGSSIKKKIDKTDSDINLQVVVLFVTPSEITKDERITVKQKI